MNTTHPKTGRSCPRLTDAQLEAIAREIAALPRYTVDLIDKYISLSIKIENPETPEQAKKLFSSMEEGIAKGTITTYTEIALLLNHVINIMGDNGGTQL